MKRLNIGCGKDIKEGWVNLDQYKGKGVNKVHDLNKTPYPFKDNTFDYILCKSVLEHLWDADKAMRDLYRILKPGGKLRIYVPYFNSGHAFRITHHTFFSRDTFFKYTDKASVHSGLEAKSMFKINKLNLVPSRFGKLFPKLLRYYASHVLGEIIVAIDIEFEKN